MSGLTLRPTSLYRRIPSTAPSGDLEVLAGVVEETMTAAGYSPRSMQPANRHDLRLLLRRLALNKRDARRILGAVSPHPMAIKTLNGVLEERLSAYILNCAAEFLIDCENAFLLKFSS
jgi:hypothetical protein